METYMHDAIASAFAEVWGLIAGDSVTHVTSSDEETQLLTIMDDTLVGEGMLFDPAGIRDQDSRDLCFLKSYLSSCGVAIEPTDHFQINGERWDYVENAPIKDALNPLGGIQDIIVVRVRRAVELEHSDAGSDWGFDNS